MSGDGADRLTRAIQSFVGYGKESGLYSKRNRRLLENLELGRESDDIIKFVFSTDHCGCCVQDGLEGRSAETGRLVREEVTLIVQGRYDDGLN